MIRDFINSSIVLSETTKRKLLRIINEELSINDSVVAETEKVFRLFMENFSEKPFKQLKNENDVSFKEVVFSENIFNTKIDFYFLCVNILSKENFDELYSKYNLGNAYTIIAQKKVVVNVPLFCGTMDTTIKSKLQHKIEHIYQLLKGKNANNLNLGNKCVEAYTKAFNVLTKKEENSKEIRDISIIIYTQADSETDAFVNQLYFDLKINTPSDSDVVLKQSLAYRYYLYSKNVLAKIKKDQQKYKDSIAYFGFTTHFFITYTTRKPTVLTVGGIVVIPFLINFLQKYNFL